MNKVALITLKSHGITIWVNPYCIVSMEKIDGNGYAIDLLNGSSRVIDTESGEKLKGLFLDDKIQIINS